jgi:hypothetical protein
MPGLFHAGRTGFHLKRQGLSRAPRTGGTSFKIRSRRWMERAFLDEPSAEYPGSCQFTQRRPTTAHSRNALHLQWKVRFLKLASNRRGSH